jgi:hypothetical protein
MQQRQEASQAIDKRAMDGYAWKRHDHRQAEIDSKCSSAGESFTESRRLHDRLAIAISGSFTHERQHIR